MRRVFAFTFVSGEGLSMTVRSMNQIMILD